MGTVPGVMIIMVIVIVVMTMVAVFAAMMMMMMMMTAPGQQHGADQIGPQTENGDERRLAEGDRARVEQAAGSRRRHRRRGPIGVLAAGLVVTPWVLGGRNRRQWSVRYARGPGRRGAQPAAWTS